MFSCRHIASALLCLSVLGLGSASVARAQQGTNFELQELKTTLEASARKITELQDQLAAQRAQNQALTQAVTSANADATAAREAYEKLRGVVEGLGIGAVSGNTNQVQERLLSLLSDLRQVDETKRSLSDALLTLSEAALSYQKLTPSGDLGASHKLDEALAKAESLVRGSSVIGTVETPKVDLHDVRVISVKTEEKLVVLSAGAKDGVKAGMPFSVYREDKSVAKLLVVDVRKSIAGAIIQEVNGAKEAVKVGDRGMIDAERSF